MQKLSKRDQDPRQINEDKEGLDRIKAMRCKHFVNGAVVIYNRKRYTINQTVGRTLVLIDETGYAIRVDNPYYMR